MSKNKKNASPLTNDIKAINGVPTIDISDMEEIISRNNMDAKKLIQAWQRNR